MSNIHQTSQTPSHIRIVRFVASLALLIVSIGIAAFYFTRPQYSAAQAGQLAYIDLRFQDAAAAFSRAIAEDSSNAQYYIGRGLAYIKLGQSEEAKIDFLKAIELDPDGDMRPYDQLTVMALIAGENETALEYADHILEITESSQGAAKAYFDRGRAYVGLKDYQSALENFKKATEYDPTVPEYFQRLGDSYYILNQMGEALNAYGQYLAIAASDEIEPYVQERVQALRGN